jgi:hypothetical protein
VVFILKPVSDLILIILDLPINNSGVLGDVNISPGGAGGKYDDKIFLFSGGFLYNRLYRR